MESLIIIVILFIVGLIIIQLPLVYQAFKASDAVQEESKRQQCKQKTDS